MKFSWIGFKTIMMKPFTILNIYFPFFNYSMEALSISIRSGILFITSTFCCDMQEEVRVYLRRGPIYFSNGIFFLIYISQYSWL